MCSALSALSAVAFLSGCSAAYWAGKDNPGTTLSINPVTRTITFANYKDTDVSIEELIAKHGDSELSLRGFSLRDNASDVRRANVEQILAVAQAQQVQVQYLAQMGANLAEMLAQLVEGIKALPGFKLDVDTPLGSGGLEIGAAEDAERTE